MPLTPAPLLTAEHLTEWLGDILATHPVLGPPFRRMTPDQLLDTKRVLEAGFARILAEHETREPDGAPALWTP